MDLDLVYLEDLFIDGNLEKCLSCICDFLSNKRDKIFHNEVLTELSRLKALRKNHHDDIISYERFTQSESKIRAKIIGFIDRLKIEKEKNHDNKIIVQKDAEVFYEETQLHGVWLCNNSSFGSDITHLWTLFPNRVGILNIINNKTGIINARLSNWSYESSCKIIIEIVNDNEIKGFIEWASPSMFKLTILSSFTETMIYEKLF
jgi:hypothetical protein